MTILEFPIEEVMTSERSGSSFRVQLKSEGYEWITGACGYQPEGPLTTFFQNESGRPSLDAWSVRVASVRTSDIVSIQRL